MNSCFITSRLMFLTDISLESISGTLANSANPDQKPQYAATDQDFHCLLTKFSITNLI